MKNLLLTASAIASIALPTLGLAQDRDDHANRDRPAAQQDNRKDARPDDRHDARPDDRHDVRPGFDQGRPGFDHARPGFDVGRPGFDHARAWNPGNRFWWRGRPEFAGFAGPRRGFWFVPGRGYVNPGPQWYGYGWRVGAFVPPGLRSYAVVDPYVYGLPPARYGFRYVYLANNVALISMRDGRIVHIIPEIY
jgi:Ni/Co efflux regulator RcnB